MRGRNETKSCTYPCSTHELAQNCKPEGRQVYDAHLYYASNRSFAGHQLSQNIHYFVSLSGYRVGTFSYLNEYCCGLCCWKTCAGVVVVLACGSPGSPLHSLPPPSVSSPTPSSEYSWPHTWLAALLPAWPQPGEKKVSMLSLSSLH